ncbi:SGNH/GDSL hydrolase family protein [Cohnella abietis]|uniref:Lipase n=1 Tax=Cohnella abietis TaxID=2507935 RepID=A0A3T1DE93_9BACL|nr:SGNH/GDSL hydrolase family protein [Cohnella abietis]BBI36409.1 lipase [Cohnella abietis]
MTIIENNAVVLFQGDSITDAERNRGVSIHLGNGYANIAASLFANQYPEKQVTFLNRGVSGDRATSLEARWAEDCLQLNPKPTWVSIYVGINDTAHTPPVNTEEFEASYRNLIQQAQEHLSAKFILIEPFVLPVNEIQQQWRVNLEAKIQVVRKLAGELKAPYVPLDGLFAAAAAQTGPEYWAPDGVHPSPAGAALIAKAWLQAVKA